MKRWIALLLVFSLLLVSCGLGPQKEDSEEETRRSRTSRDTEDEDEESEDREERPSRQDDEDSDETEPTPSEPEPVEITEDMLPENSGFAGTALPGNKDKAFRLPELADYKGLRAEDANGAGLALMELWKELGISEEAQFSGPRVTQDELGSCYRFDQVIDGIPVDGGTVSLMTDLSSNVKAVTGKTIDPAAVDLSVHIPETAAVDRVKQEHGKDISVLTVSRKIVTDGDSGRVVWEILGDEGGEPVLARVSASDGSLISYTSLAKYDAAVGSGVNNDGETVEFATERRGDSYFLEDAEYGIRVYDMENKRSRGIYVAARTSFSAEDSYLILKDDFRSQGANGIRYTALKNGEEDDAHDYLLIYEDGELLLRADGSTLPDSPSLELMHSDDAGKLKEVLRDSDNVWENEAAVTAMDEAGKTLRFWQEILHRKGYDGKGSPLSVFVNYLNSNASWTEKLFGSGNAVALPVILPHGDTVCTVHVSKDYELFLDVFAHEFTHAVIASYANLGGSGYYYPEANALNEGLADLMAECTEAYVNGSCDWNHPSAGRNLKDPAAGGNPACYQKENWYFSTSETPEVNDDRNDEFAHVNSTVISHMGYLMASGALEKPAATLPLGEELTARLVYLTFPYLSEDTDFAEYATILYHTAVEMYRAGSLSAEQVRCVFRAMEEVGLFPVYELSASGELELQDLNRLGLKNFSIDIYTLSVMKIKDVPVSLLLDFEGAHTHADVEDGRHFVPELPVLYGMEGELYYKACITNNDAEDEDFTFILKPDSSTAGRIITAPFLLSAGMINNGGRFVEYQGNTYYWRTNPDSYAADGVMGYFMTNIQTVNQLMKRSSNGEEEIIYTGPGYDRIFISGDRLYTTTGTMYVWRSLALDGTDEILLDKGEILGVDPESGAVIKEETWGNGQRHLAAVSPDGTVRTISNDGYDYQDGPFLYCIEGGKAYYGRHHKSGSDSMEVIAFEADLLEETEPRYLGHISVKPEPMSGVVSSAVVGRDALYVSFSQLGGTGMFYYLGGIYKFSLEGDTAPELLVSPGSGYALGYPYIHYAWSGKAEDHELLYFLDGDSMMDAGESIVAPDVSLVHILDLNDRTFREADMPLIADGKVALMYRDGGDAAPSVECYTEDGTELMLAAPGQLLDSEGLVFSGLTKAGNDVLKYCDLTGSKTYLEFWRLENGDNLGWRTGFTRTGVKVYEIDRKTWEMKLVYGY